MKTRASKFISLILWLCISPLAYAFADQTPGLVVTAKPIDPRDERYRYVETLLEKILRKNGTAEETARLVQADASYSRNRMLRELISGENLHVVAEVANPEWEDKLLPIHIPIRKGIHGYRLFLINRQDQFLFSNIETLADLKRVSTGSGQQWAVRNVMEESGFNVVTSDSYATLFDMLKVLRFKSFGRGIDEVFREYETFSQGNSDLVVEDSLALYFPLPTYFYVSPKRPELARAIESGLKKMLQDRSFDQHFLDYYQQDILKAKLWKRRIFRVSNPILAREMTFDVVAGWDDPEVSTDFGLR
jgi:hypothetical protein